jgi:F-type H+-transporting ATPase subunit delta
LATRYATALFELASERKALDRVEADLRALDGLIVESEELARLIATPVVARDELGRAVDAIAAQAGLTELTRNFLGVLAQQRRLAALPQIVRAFEAMLAAQRGETTAEVTSATELAPEQLELLEKRIAAFAGKRVQLSTAIDPSLLGGVVVRVGSRMIDASLRSKLKQLELAMRGIA